MRPLPETPTSRTVFERYVRLQKMLLGAGSHPATETIAGS